MNSPYYVWYTDSQGQLHKVPQFTKDAAVELADEKEGLVTDSQDFLLHVGEYVFRA